MFSDSDGPSFARMRAELALAKELQECRRSLATYPVCPLPESHTDDPCPVLPESREAEGDRTTADGSSKSAAADGDSPERRQDTDSGRMRRVSGIGRLFSAVLTRIIVCFMFVIRNF